MCLVLQTGAQAQQAAPGEIWRIPPIDYSYAGYHGGGRAPSILQATVLVRPAEGDDGDRIQAAVDLVSARAPDRSGHRGVVQLAAGDYQISGQIRIRAAGVVLRGAGASEQGTRLIAVGHDRRALVSVGADPEPAGRAESAAEPVAVTADTAVGAVELRLSSVSGLAVGDRITVRRASTQAWIESLGMDQFVGWRPEGRLNWLPGSRDVIWDRRIVEIKADSVVLDAPLTLSLSPQTAPGTVT
ncbi:hypothetical protein LTR94_027721, partial [Friedmanniomyces endolithicus]